MLLGKLKAIVVCAGALSVVVSSAVVLAQSGEPQKGSVAAAETDRISAMERKLDRILDALDRMTAGASPMRNRVQGLQVPPTTARFEPLPAGDEYVAARDLHSALAPLKAGSGLTSTLTPQGGTIAGADQGGPPAAALASTIAHASQNKAVTDRLDSMEKMMEQFQERLTRLERRLAGSLGLEPAKGADYGEPKR